MPPKKSAIGGRNKQFVENNALRIILPASKPQPYHKATDLDNITLENIFFAEHIPSETHVAVTLCQHKNRMRLVSNIVLRRLFHKTKFVYNLGGTIVQSNPIIAATRFKNRMHVDNDPEKELVCIYPDTLLEDLCPEVSLGGSPATSLEEFFIECSTAANYSPPAPKTSRKRKPQAHAAPPTKKSQVAKSAPDPEKAVNGPPAESKEFTGAAQAAYRTMMKAVGRMYQFVPQGPVEHAWNVDRIFPVTISNLGEIGPLKKGGDLSLSFDEGTLVCGLDDAEYNSSTLAVTPRRKIIYPSRSERFFGDSSKFFGIYAENRALIKDEIERGALKGVGATTARNPKEGTGPIRVAESEQSKLAKAAKKTPCTPTKNEQIRPAKDTSVNSPLLTTLTKDKPASPVPARTSEIEPKSSESGNKRKRSQDEFVATLAKMAATDMDDTAGAALDQLDVNQHGLMFKRLLVPAYKRIREAVRRECMGQLLDAEAIAMAQEFLQSTG